VIETGIDLHDPKHLDALAVEQLDALPVGTIRVDSEGRILFYSRTEAALTGRDPQQVLGRNFFTEIAPCTVVPEFYGRFLRGVVLGHLYATFEFVFDFAMQPVQVRITMRDSEQPDEYWIIVEPIRKLPSADRDSAASLIAQKFGSDQESDAADTVLSTASFDFSVCDKEPITTCGAVQPFAALLALDAAGRRIEVASANTSCSSAWRRKHCSGATSPMPCRNWPSPSRGHWRTSADAVRRAVTSGGCWSDFQAPRKTWRFASTMRRRTGCSRSSSSPPCRWTRC
jgi:photoactive yellow protein